MTRISMHDLTTAINKVRRMTLAEKGKLAEEIHRSQPHLLALSLVPSRFGVMPVSLETLIHILMVCYQAMKESGLRWPVITEPEIETQLTRWIGAVQFADWASASADQARTQYLDQHAERPLLAYVLDEINGWLRERARHGEAEDEDKFVIMAGITLVNCVAAAPLVLSLG